MLHVFIQRYNRSCNHFICQKAIIILMSMIMLRRRLLKSHPSIPFHSTPFYSILSYPIPSFHPSHLIQSNLMPSHLSTYRCWPLLIIRSSRPPHPLPWSCTSTATATYISTQAMGEACTWCRTYGPRPNSRMSHI